MYLNTRMQTPSFFRSKNDNGSTLTDPKIIDEEQF